MSLCLANVLLAGELAEVNIDTKVVGTPTWHNYGSTYKDAQGNVTTLNIEVPFFPVTSIKTMVYVELDSADIVVTKLQAKRANGNTDLMVAATAGDLDTVKTLLGKGAMVNTKNTFGSTALMGAAAGGFTNIVSLLIAKGARVNEKNNQGHTALMLAAANGEKAMVTLLLNKKAEVDLVDSGNHTALMYAINGNYEDVVKTLIERGARKDYKDRSGMTPEALASTKKNPELTALLSTQIKPAE